MDTKGGVGVETDIYTLLILPKNQVTNEKLPYNTRNRGMPPSTARGSRGPEWDANPEEGNPCKHRADSLCRMVEMNTTSQSNYNPPKIHEKSYREEECGGVLWGVKGV